MEQQLIPQGRFDTRFWREDLRAGLILAPLSIAFGIGIAGISLFPSQSGLVSAVVAMMALFLYGGSYIVVCGAAAALAPILATAVIALGQGDLVLGYQRTLAIIVITGPIMYVMGWRRLTQYMAALCAHSVTAGMLAAIAVMLAIGRLGTFTGVELKNKSHGLFALYEFFWEGRFTETVGLVLLVAVGTFAALVILSFYQKRFVILRRYPPQLIVILLLLVVGALLPLGQEYRINIPEDFWSFHRWPDFDLVAMWQVGVLGDFAKGVGTLGLVDPLETVATVLVIDQYDKYRRRSDVNKVVSAMGIANAVSGFAGGMSNIPGGAKSTISAMLGTVTAWASLYGAVAIVLIVVFARETLNLFPLAGLSAVIVFTVMKLCAPAKWREFREVGRDQYAVFIATFGISVLAWDILWGILAGILVHLGIVAWLTAKVMGLEINRLQFWNVLKVIWRLCSNPKAEITLCPQGQSCAVHFAGPWYFFNKSELERVLAAIPSTVTSVHFHVGEKVVAFDQPMVERLRHYLHDRQGKLHFGSHLLKVSEHEDSTRYAPFPMRPARA